MEDTIIEQTVKEGDILFLANSPDSDASEAHGFVCGLVAGGISSVDEIADLASKNILSGSDFLDEVKEWLAKLARAVLEQYSGMETLDIPLEERCNDAESLTYYISLWAQAFLFGFGCATKVSEMTAEARECISDITAFTQIDEDDGTDISDEELDEMYFTFTEHLKVCAMSLYAEFGAPAGTVRPKVSDDEDEKLDFGDDGELVIRDDGIHFDELMARYRNKR